ncbi:MAG: signal peptide peptidase SppA [Pontixanthobacter sp.]
MAFAGKVWRLLVGIKDGLSLLFLLLFFALLFGALSARPSPAQVREGALLIDLDGVIVEERSAVDPFALLVGGQAPVGEYTARDVVHALETAAADPRINSVVLDLSRFLGGGQVHLQTIGEAMDRVRAADKPVFAYAIGYADSGMMLAAHASEVWLDPLGGAVVTGPGGSRLYFGGLIEKLNVNARVYKVGSYKSAVEPYTRTDMSPEARENAAALYGALWEEWQANVRKARPGADLARVTNTPAEWVAAADGDLAEAALAAGLVDKLGTREQFGARVAEVAGEDPFDDLPGTFAFTQFDVWLADNPIESVGDAIGVVTIAGQIVDGEEGPGVAGGDRIAALLDNALSDDLKALVVRVDSPGGSVLASEEIRQAILRHKAKGIPIVVSMANVAASGGYWVATPAEQIFAEPETVTGSIGIFAVIPTFERASQELGINSDGVQTTPLSGQPDLISGFTPEIDAILQSSVENGYRDFLRRVAASRDMTLAQADAVGQGRVWDGGTARQIGLVDRYGGIEDAIAYAASRAELADGEWHVRYLSDMADPFDAFLRDMFAGQTAGSPNGDMFAMVAGRQQRLMERARTDFDYLMTSQNLQAYCLECPASSVSKPMPKVNGGWIDVLRAYMLK